MLRVVVKGRKRKHITHHPRATEQTDGRERARGAYIAGSAVRLCTPTTQPPPAQTARRHENTTEDNRVTERTLHIHHPHTARTHGTQTEERERSKARDIDPIDGFRAHRSCFLTKHCNVPDTWRSAPPLGPRPAGWAASSAPVVGLFVCMLCWVCQGRGEGGPDDGVLMLCVHVRGGGREEALVLSVP